MSAAQKCFQMELVTSALLHCPEWNQQKSNFVRKREFYAETELHLLIRFVVRVSLLIVCVCLSLCLCVIYIWQICDFYTSYTVGANAWFIYIGCLVLFKLVVHCTAVCAGLQIMGGPGQFFVYVCLLFVCACLSVSFCVCVWIICDRGRCVIYTIYAKTRRPLVNLVVQQFAQVCN